MLTSVPIAPVFVLLILHLQFMADSTYLQRSFDVVCDIKVRLAEMKDKLALKERDLNELRKTYVCFPRQCCETAACVRCQALQADRSQLSWRFVMLPSNLH